jgi:SAM-dependent methyltransferase
MIDRSGIHRQMRDHYQAVWQSGDAWEFETSEFEQNRYEFLLKKLGCRRYGQVLEIGCGSGCFTRLLAGVSDRVVALDIAAAAIERARVQTAGAGPGVVDLRVANIMDFDLQAEGTWDLIVFSETMYILGWLYPLFDVAWLATRLFDSTARGGRLLLTNTYGQKDKDWLMQPLLIDTYRDLFRNAGYRLENEEILHDAKNGTEFRVLVSMLTRNLT